MRPVINTLCATVIALVFAACSSNTDPTTAAYWVDQLGDLQKRNEALKELAKIGDATAVPAVVELLNEEGDWQPDAAFTLGQLGDASVAKDLIGVIDYQVGTGRDRTSQRKNRINQNVCRALAELKAKEGVVPLTNLLGTREDKTKEQAILALGKIGDTAATKDLLKIALEEPQPFIRKRAVQALGDLRDPKAVPALVKMLYVELPGVSFYNEARFSLQQVGSAAVPELVKTLARKNKEVEEVRLPSGDTIAPGAIEAKAAFVLGALRAKSAEAQIVGAVNTYYRQFQKRAKEPVFASVPGAVMEMAYALGNLGGGKPSIDMLTKIATDTDANMRVSATEALTTLGAHDSVPTLLKAAKTGNKAAKRHALTAVSLLGDGEHLAGFDAFKKDLPKFVAANRGPLEAAKACKKDAGCWQGKLADANVKVRQRAAYQLGWMMDKGSVEALMKAAEDDDASVRMASVLSLGRFGGVESDALQAIHDKWSQKIEYKNVNAELRRLIARVKSTAPTS